MIIIYSIVLIIFPVVTKVAVQRVYLQTLILSKEGQIPESNYRNLFLKKKKKKCKSVLRKVKILVLLTHLPFRNKGQKWPAECK